MLIISRKIVFSATHKLVNVPKWHPCAKAHKHEYIAEVRLTGQIDKAGMIVDFYKVDEALRNIALELNNSDLNKIINTPTVECIAVWFFNEAFKHIRGLVSVRISEAEDDGWAEYTPDSYPIVLPRIKKKSK